MVLKDLSVVRKTVSVSEQLLGCSECEPVCQPSLGTHPKYLSALLRAPCKGTLSMEPLEVRTAG